LDCVEEENHTVDPDIEASDLLLFSLDNGRSPIDLDEIKEGTPTTYDKKAKGYWKSIYQNIKLN